MKSPTRLGTISRFSMIERKHYWVSFQPEIKGTRSRQFDNYEDARRYALKRVYRRNLSVYD
jgi:hypothetical protein